MMRSLKLQLLFSHLLLVLLMVVVMIGAIINFNHLGGSIDRILKDNYKSVRAAQEMKEALERQDSAANFYATGEVGLARRQYEENWPLFSVAYGTEAHNITEVGEQQAVDDIGRWYSEYRQRLGKMLYAKPSLGKSQAHDLYFGSLKPAFERIKRRSQNILDLNQNAIVSADQRAKAEARNATLTGIAVTLGAGVLALGFVLRMIQSALQPLRSLARQAEEIGAGHWNQRIELRRDDEIGALADSFNAMAAKLREAWRLEEQRLHRAERMSDAALESLYDPVIVTDDQERIVHLNRAAEGLFGSEEQAVGRTVTSAIQDKRIADALTHAIHREQVSAAEGEAGFVTLQVGSSQRTYRLRATPMRDDDGSLLGAVAVLEDLTHLRELDRLKTEFIGVASHELRTPVTSLLLSVQLLQEGAVGVLTPDQQEVIAAQREDLERLERMMRDLLDVTRLEAGVTPPRFEIVGAAEIAQSAGKAVAAQAESKGVSLQIEATEDLPCVRADPALISRVLINLLNNGIRHTPVGGTVTLAAIHLETAVHFSVKDTGTGIPAEYLPRIFEKFVQVPGATRGGAGLGLSIAQTILLAHGSELKAESEEGQGSRFYFELPVIGETAQERDITSRRM